MRIDPRVSLLLALSLTSACAARTPAPARRVIVVDKAVQQWTVQENCARVCAKVSRPGERVACSYGRLDRDVELGRAMGFYVGVVCILSPPDGASR